MKKKGQIFLTIAVIILLLGLSLLLVKNLLLKSPDFKEDKTPIFKGGNILSTGKYASGVDLIYLIQELKLPYQKRFYDGEKIYFIFIEEKTVSLFEYSEILKGTISLEGTGGEDKVLEEVYTRREINVEDGKIKISIGGKGYTFEVEQNKRVYIIIGEDE